MIEIDAIEVQLDGSQVRKSRTVPRYLFRGEDGDSSKYPTTFSAWERLEAAKELGADDRSEVRGLAQKLLERLCSSQYGFGLPKHDMFGLAQHFGLPTEYIDFSADLGVALAFAVGGSRTPDERGSICVLDVGQAVREGHLADLRRHQMCDRARRQQAYGYAPIGFKDLKSAEGVARAGLQWFEFSVHNVDIERYGRTFRELLETKSDPIAGLFRNEINRYVADTGKLRSQTAKWIVNRIPMVPLVARDHDSEGVEFLPPCDHLRWDERQEKLASLCYWSLDHNERLGNLHVSADESGLIVYPGTHHPD